MTHTAIQANNARLRSPGVLLTIEKSERAATEPRTAVDGEDLTGDERGMRRHEEHRGVGHFLGLAPPSQRNEIGDALDRLRSVPQLLRGAGRFDWPGRDGVDADA